MQTIYRTNSLITMAVLRMYEHEPTKFELQSESEAKPGFERGMVAIFNATPQLNAVLHKLRRGEITVNPFVFGSTLNETRHKLIAAKTAAYNAIHAEGVS